MGKPAVKGARLTVAHIMRELSGGMPVDDVLDAHPRLTLADVEAAGSSP